MISDELQEIRTSLVVLADKVDHNTWCTLREAALKLEKISSEVAKIEDNATIILEEVWPKKELNQAYT